MSDPEHSSRYKFAKAAGDKLTCCYLGCDEPATVDVWRADAYFCEDHYLMNILRMGCDLKGTAIEQQTSNKT